MKNSKKILFASLLALGLIVTTGCTDTRFPRSFTVNFIEDPNMEQIPSQVVREGYKIENVGTPTNIKEALFAGWVVVDNEGNELEQFDIKEYRVFKDLTLKAKWIYPSTTPQAIELGSDAFTKSITWIQSNVDVNDIGVRAKEGNIDYQYTYDENYDKNLVSGVRVQYPSDVYNDLDGTLTKVDDYHYIFTATTSKQCYYGIEIYSKSGSFTTVKVDDVRFKGSGTIDNPYLVYNETDLKYLTTNSFDENTYAKLMNDITISSLYNEKTNAVFNGHLDGNKSNGDLKISENYSITLKNNSALFMTLGEKGTVTNVNFKGSISGSNPSMGVVANYSYGTITHVDSQAVSVKSDGGFVNNLESAAKGGSGGIVGTNYGTIKNCTVSSARDNVIQGRIAVGGICGINYGTVSDMRVDAIVGAYNGVEYSTTVANSYSGCVCGINHGTIARIDVNNGKINTRRIEKGNEGDGACNVGGVCGYNASDGIVEKCLFDGMRCVGDTNVGGIVGYNEGIVRNCYTGRRLRSPSNTTVTDRRFISPVIGSFNVGGIVGKCGEGSVVSHCFSTANVWSYGMKGYTIAEKADHCIGVSYNQHPRSKDTYLGQKYGVPYSNTLQEPYDENESNYIIDNSFIIMQPISWGLGYVMDENGLLVLNLRAVKAYLNILGPEFGLRESSTHGIRLTWESSVKTIDELDLPMDE